MRHTRLASAVAALALVAPLNAQQGTLSPVDGSKQYLAARGLVVAPIPRSEISNLVDAGTIECEGFDHLVLNLALEMKGPVEPGGSVGAVLVPDVFPYDRVYRVLQILPATTEITIPLEGTSAYLSARQTRIDVGFPRYRVLLWNSGRTSVLASVSVWRAKS